MTTQEINIYNFWNKKANSNLEEYKELKIVSYTIANLFAVAIWARKQKNPFRHYSFRSFEKMQNFINEMKAVADRNEKRIARRKAEKAAYTQDLNVGDIYASSWGYEQTNVSFYQVIEVKGKCTIVLREIAQKTIEGSEGNMSCHVTAVQDKFLNDKTIQKRVSNNRVKITSCENAYKWDGRPKYKSWYY